MARLARAQDKVTVGSLQTTTTTFTSDFDHIESHIMFKGGTGATCRRSLSKDCSQEQGLPIASTSLPSRELYARHGLRLPSSSSKMEERRRPGTALLSRETPRLVYIGAQEASWDLPGASYTLACVCKTGPAGL